MPDGRGPSPAAGVLMAIRCGVCGEEHTSVAELRRLHPPGSVADDPSFGEPPVSDDDVASPWEDVHAELRSAAASDTAPPPKRAFTRAPATAQPDAQPDVQRGATRGPVLRGAPPTARRAVGNYVVRSPEGVGRGPAVLGRTLVIVAGSVAPPEWLDCQHIHVDLESPVIYEDLARLWWSRTPFVAIVDEAELARLCQAANWTERRAAWELGAHWAPPLEQLAHYVLANAANVLPNESEVAAGTVVDGGPLEILTNAESTTGATALDSPGGIASAQVVHRALLGAKGAGPWRAGRPTAELAADQLAAVAQPRLAARIIAPAGSGKTRVLTERARYLLRECGLAASAMTLVAFNTRAADEMRARTDDLPGLQIRTLNALAFKIAQMERPGLRTILERDVRAHIDRLVRIPRQRNADPTASWLEALSAVRLGLRSPGQVEADFGGDVAGFAEFFPRFEELLADRGETDFDGQIATALRLLCVRPDIRETVRASCRVLCVDEFQDLTPAHLLMVRLLAGPDGAVFGVGDDDQTIYGYNDASPRWLIDFARTFPGAAEHALEVNYRCPPEVVEAAASLLSHNRIRLDKRIVAAPGRARRGEGLVIERATSTAKATVEAVRQLVEGGVAAGEIAVLTRVSAALLPVQVGLVEHGVKVVSAVDTTLLERTGIRGCLAWLRVATGHIGPRDLAEAARRPSRKLSPKVLEWIGEQRDIDGVERLAKRLKADRDREAVDDFASDGRTLVARARGGATSGELLIAVRDEIGLGAAMESLDQSKRSLDRSSQGDDLVALVSLAALHPNADSFESWLRGRLQVASDPSGVMLSTVHRVKGLEWPYVVVHDVSEGLFPHRLAQDVEEERRIFHVALTRSQTQTVVVSSASAPSPFVHELQTAYDPSAVRVVASRERPLAAASASALAGTAASGGVVSRSGAGAGPLAEALRAWRTQRARADSVPPYVIMHNTTLDEIARVRPTNRVALSRVSGMGPAKLGKYGEEVVAVVIAALS